MSDTESPRKQCFIVNAQAREMAYRVLTTCLEEKQNHILSIHIDRPWDRAVEYTGLSKATLNRIHKEGQENNGNFNVARSRKIYLHRKNTFDIDEFDRQAVHRCIEEFYLEEKSLATFTALHRVLKEKVAFPWGKTTLRKMLNQMGFTCNTQNIRHIAENPSVFAARKKYIEKITEYRSKGKKIFYIDETWFDLEVPFKKYWRLETENSIMTDTNAKNRLVLIHAASKNGFLSGAQWLFEVGITQGEYQIQMSKENFTLWVTKLLITKLPPRSVVVMDSASYHNELLNEVPTRESTKEEMFTWLINNTDYSIDNVNAIDKVSLYSMIEVSKSNVTPKYKIDHFLNFHGHEVLRLPPHMAPVFSPIMMAWEKIATNVESQVAQVEGNQKTKRMTVNTLRLIVEASLGSMKNADWREFEEKVIAAEETYWIRDSRMETEMKRVQYCTNLEGSDNNKSEDSGEDGGD